MLEQFRTKSATNSHNKFECKDCLYRCSKESDLIKHLNTRKHKNRTKLNVLEQNGEKLADYGLKSSCKKQSGDFFAKPLFECECGKKYTARNSLWYHRKSCYIHQGEVSNKKPNIINTTSNYENINNNSIVNDNSNNNYNDILSQSKEKESEFKELVLMLLKENKEIQKNFLEMIPYMKGNAENSFNTTNTNSHNTNHFNIQMFLNERCKNAMNLTDFIDSLPITTETYDHTIENGLTKTITHMITNGLNNMDILERPIHCTDPARKTMYIKDNDVWEKDNELKCLLHGIKSLSIKQRTTINKWQDANEGWDRDENLQTKLTTLVFHSMSDVENDEKELSKIIRAISKNTYLSNDIKEEYK